MRAEVVRHAGDSNQCVLGIRLDAYFVVMLLATLLYTPMQLRPTRVFPPSHGEEHVLSTLLHCAAGAFA